MRLLVSAAFAAIATVALVVAASADAKDDHCAAATAMAKAMTANLPIEVDAVTQTVGVEAACDARELSLSRHVALKQSRMESDFKDFLQAQDDEFACTDKARRTLVDAGWKWITTYKFQDGEPVVITANCHNKASKG